MKITPDNIHFIQGNIPSNDFSLSALQTPVTSGAVTGTTTVADIVYNSGTSAGAINAFKVVSTAQNTSFSSDTPAIATVDSATGQVTYVANGTATIAATARNIGTRKISQAISNSVTQANISVNSYGAGSLRKYLSDQMTAICNHATANLGGSTEALQRFVNGTPSLTLLTGLTGVAGFTPFDVSRVALSDFGAVWISPHHYIRGIGWAHNAAGGTYPAYGSNLVWVGQDIVVGYSATAWAGQIVKFLPTNWRTYLPVHSESFPMSGVPSWVRFANTYNGSSHWVEPIYCNAASGTSQIAIPTNNAFIPYLKTQSGVIATGGDSGSPVFIGINGTPVLAGRVWGYGGSIDWYGNYLTAATVSGNTGTITGQDSRTYASDITTAMNMLAGFNSDATVYSLQTVDLSGFTVY